MNPGIALSIIVTEEDGLTNGVGLGQVREVIQVVDQVRGSDSLEDTVTTA